MRFDFIEKPINTKDIPKEYPVDFCLVENNERQIEQICEFLLDDKSPLLLVNGFRGSGKSQIINFAINYAISPQTVILNYNCPETTILDDLLLSFFEDFRNYTMMGMITPPKIKVENFTQKINSYFNTITNPILIVLNSFDAIIKENRPDIINFVKHLTKFQNIKVIIISKALQTDFFQDIETYSITTLPLSQKIFEKYLRQNNVKQIGALTNELYKQTKGYYSQVQLTVNILNARQIALVNLLELFSKSYVPYPEFIIREALALVDPVSAHLFRLLTVMRIPIHVNLIKSLRMFDEGKIMFFINNAILALDGECLYLKDEFRYLLENQIPENVLVKLHTACIDLYNTQLPLKPLERDLKLSRQTMRNEIEYHSMFLPKKPELNPKAILQLQVSAPQASVVDETPQTPAIQEPVQIEETKEEKINKISFIIEDEGVLDNIADSIKDFVVTTAEDSKLEQESNVMTLQQILNCAKQEEAAYNYKHAVMLYQSALTKTADDDFYTFLPSIYVKLAKAYQNLSDLYEALEYYTQAQDFYFNASNDLKVCEIKLEIANIYYLMYKHENAKYLLTELEQTKNLPNELAIKINLAIAKLTDDINREYKYYEKSIPLIEPMTDKSVVSELYYKFAVVNDEKEDIRSAANYYKKCIETDKNPKTNPCLAMALSNLAQLYDETGQTKFAIKYYQESINADTQNQNLNGLYNSAIHLAEIYSAFNDSNQLEYLNKALEYAQKLNETFYIANASLELADYYFLRKNYENAYKYSIQAYNVAQSSFTKDNLNKITSRLDDIKRRIPETLLNQYQEKYAK
ncbi:MAG: tetratricopeptide repeat protein [Muribaculaceae bacterium]|nr:tetratricopeptide repeat protein [Muribaculaceae bacterium]